ncbi:MAG TPA: nucleotidyltransferase domain-containing protein [Leptospiraceae bacterium]|nr:nucleotidyltransferase domain-containing protein [Leptospiraceae bacterium]HMX32938.1 nucleotidyltransferase domain-containing protein [Leptospiraceae bacterium]HMY33965.1 nucleotidyltransferase domain-containing protein [Leptospiraceae bacterium]HMZ65676.1 nucleotidyltransferase domain-containing protein [Leptospiraceae bacterium]HNA09337.1 nucleotidyltransferase domain-containing protein [Leptospiraceae bacterium]
MISVNIEPNQISNIRDVVKGYFQTKPVNKVYLFGSYARKEAGKNSDIDLLLDLIYEPGIAFIFGMMKQELELLLHKKVDLITTNSISKYIAENIEKEKILIYEKI